MDDELKLVPTVELVKELQARYPIGCVLAFELGNADVADLGYNWETYCNGDIRSVNMLANALVQSAYQMACKQFKPITRNDCKD